MRKVSLAMNKLTQWKIYFPVIRVISVYLQFLIHKVDVII